MIRLFTYAAQTLDLSPLPHANTDGVIPKILTEVFVIMGVVAVLMIVIGGFMYITSQGNPDKMAKAKDTIIYAIVGLFILIFATAIVHFVTGKTT